MMRDVAIIGCSMTKFGRLDGKDLMEILVEASLKAIDDAGVSECDFDSVYVGNMLAGELSHQSAIASALVDRINLIPASAERIENGPASGGSAVKNGFLAVASGASDMVLVAGGEKMTGVDTSTISDLMSTLNHPDAEYVHGATMPAMAALFTRLYMERYSLTERHLAMVAVKNHANGMKNPYAALHKLCTVEDAMTSAMVSDPLRLYHCCPISDGAAAVVLCPAEKAKEFTTKPVKILGFGHATDTHTLQEREDPIILKSVKIAAERAFKMAKLNPRDMDVAELHDAFAILEIAESEDIGFFKKGEGQLALEKGVTAIDGELPINPSGGLKSKGHPVGATGVAQIVELVWQLRGEAGQRQVKDPERALACNFGGFGNNTIIHILERGD
ncbi:MAG: thiolase domain-containing protein [Candidatus Methanoperedens sp.]